jgi:hypothetical protein
MTKLLGFNKEELMAIMRIAALSLLRDQEDDNLKEPAQPEEYKDDLYEKIYGWVEDNKVMRS